jgi:Ca2+-binding RTX toxin-like protein
MTTGATLSLTVAQLAGVERVAAHDGATAGGLDLVGEGTARQRVEGLETLSVLVRGNDVRLALLGTGPDPTDMVVTVNPSSLPQATRIRTGGGGDLLRAFGGENDFAARRGADTLEGGGGRDSLDGGKGQDQLGGDEGDDLLTGGDGHDLLIGGRGRDVLVGGAGGDRFLYQAPDEGFDRIADFGAGADLIVVSAETFGGGLVAGVPLAAGQLVVHAASTATAAAGTGQFIFNRATSVLLWDADGAGGGAAVALARLVGVNSLATTDLEVIA